MNLLVVMLILVLPALMVGLGIVALKNPDLMWKWRSEANRRRGIVDSRRTEAWERSNRQRGIIVLGLGIVTGIFLVAYMLNLFTSPFF
jgi:hypothetical protein